jgi:phage-related baseplate assembly protein
VSIIDLTQLPPPDAVEALDFEQIYQDMLAAFRAAMGGGWSAALESDPVVKLLELAAYRELQVRARINDAARASLLAFAGGADLDHLAAFYGVRRMPGQDGMQGDGAAAGAAAESDERLRLRVQLRAAALAGNGTAEQYRHTALSATPLVRDAAVLPAPPGRVTLAVWPGHAADGEAALAAVRQAFMADDARPLGVPLDIVLAEAVPLDVTATVRRDGNAPPDLVALLRTALPELIAANAKLGRELPDSWLSSRLYVEGVAEVALSSSRGETAPPLLPHQYLAPGAVVMHDGGIAW